MVSLFLRTVLDGAGDGWVELRAQGAETLVGMRLNLIACTDATAVESISGCATVGVFGGADGAAEDAGWFFAAGHAMSHGVFGFCLSGPCGVVSDAQAPPVLLTRLSVALPIVANGTVICTSRGDLVFTSGREGDAATAGASDTGQPATLTRTIPLPPTCSPPLTFGASPGGAAGTGLRRGVAFVKTYKTGSSTIASLLQRRADIRSIEVVTPSCAPPHHRLPGVVSHSGACGLAFRPAPAPHPTTPSPLHAPLIPGTLAACPPSLPARWLHAPHSRRAAGGCQRERRAAPAQESRAAAPLRGAMGAPHRLPV